LQRAIARPGIGAYNRFGILVNVLPNLTLLFATLVSLPWVENDYAKALAQAKSHHVPVFVEVWAPW
jgi:hypothetical protein